MALDACDVRAFRSMSPESSLAPELGAETPSDDVAEEVGFADAVSAESENKTLDSLRAPVVAWGTTGSCDACCAMSSSLPACAMEPNRSAPPRLCARVVFAAVAADVRGTVETTCGCEEGCGTDTGAGPTGADAAAFSASTISVT